MIATTRGALLRGSTTDALGDEVDVNSTPLRTYTDWVEARRNLASVNVRGTVGNPPLAPNRAGIYNNRWFGANGGAGTRTTLPEGGPSSELPSFTRKTWTSLPTSASDVAFSLTASFSGVGVSKNGYPVDALSPLALSLFVRASFALTTSRFKVVWRDAAGAPLTQPAITARIEPGEAWTRIGAVFVPPADAAFMEAIWDAVSTAPPSLGDYIDGTGFLLERSGEVFEYLDGNLTTGEFTRARWLGDPGESESVLETRELIADYSNFPVSIIEKSRREFDEASNAWRSVRYFAGRVPSNVPVQAGDRIRDNRDGAIYAVGEVERMARGLSGRSSVTLTMKRTSP